MLHSETKCKMQLAHDHITEMRRIHHIKSFQKMVLCVPPIFMRGDLREPQEHRRIDIDWWPGKTKGSLLSESILKSDLCTSLLKYDKDGYRAYTIEQNGLRSSIRIAKSLTALELYYLMLESRSLTSFKQLDHLISMDFMPKLGRTSRLEASAAIILRRVKDHTFTIMPNGLDIQSKVTFMMKDKPVDPELQELLNRAKRCKDCKDCKDGYYYPLMGPRERCQTCKT